MPEVEIPRQGADELVIVRPAGDGHGDDDAAVVLTGNIREHVQVERPPHGVVLEVAGEKGRRKIFPDEEPGVFRVVHVGVRHPAAELPGRLGLSRAEGAVEPDDHMGASSLLWCGNASTISHPCVRNKIFTGGCRKNFKKFAPRRLDKDLLSAV